MTDAPRYPEVRVRLHSHHPLALMGAVREALRHAGAGADELQAFSRGAAARDPAEVEQWCRQWARIDFYPTQSDEEKIT